MILIISTCKEKLSEEEFVRPITDIIGKRLGQKYQVIKYTAIKDINHFKRYSKIILCGTALQDFKYLNHLQKFSWIKEINQPVLGICSGAQIIGLVFGAKLVDCREIGMVSVKVLKKNSLISENFEAYTLHQLALRDLNHFEILAKSKRAVQIIKLKDKEIYGILFHPEVRKEEIIKRFISM